MTGQNSQQAVVLQDDDDDMGEMRAPSNLSTGGTPLRRSSPALLNPSRPASNPREAASNPRDGLLRRISYEELRDRPRSNPRSRTPMRYESPLNANAFRPDTSPIEGQRVTVRPFAGAAVGTTLLSRRILEERGARRSTTPTMKSSRQGPGQRKIQRWNNDGFVGLASELARHASHAGVAETLLLAQADAPMYRSIMPEAGPSVLTNFMQDTTLESVRHQFFEGEIGHGGTAAVIRKQPLIHSEEPAVMLKRIHERLRNVLFRACTNSEATLLIIDAFEACLKSSFLKGKAKSLKQVDTLLEVPTVSIRTSGHTTARFCFDASSSTGGFHRLLLHAVCQFHGLNAISTTTTLTTSSGETVARLLTVTGKRLVGADINLTEYIKLTESASASVDNDDMGQLQVGVSAATIKA